MSIVPYQMFKRHSSFNLNRPFKRCSSFNSYDFIFEQFEHLNGLNG